MRTLCTLRSSVDSSRYLGVNMKNDLDVNVAQSLTLGILDDLLRCSHISAAISLKDAFKNFPAALEGRGSVEMTSMTGTAKAGSLQIHQYMRRIPRVRRCIEKTHRGRMKCRSSTSVICMPGFGTTNATGSSPSRASGTAAAAQDRTRPSSYNAFSMETAS